MDHILTLYYDNELSIIRDFSDWVLFPEINAINFYSLNYMFDPSLLHGMHSGKEKQLLQEYKMDQTSTDEVHPNQSKVTTIPPQPTTPHLDM